MENEMTMVANRSGRDAALWNGNLYLADGRVIQYSGVAPMWTESGEEPKNHVAICEHVFEAQRKERERFEWLAAEERKEREGREAREAAREAERQRRIASPEYRRQQEQNAAAMKRLFNSIFNSFSSR